MENNVYAAPSAKLIDENNQPAEAYYILPIVKLWLYNLVSLGIFTLPWFYLHWRQVKRTVDSDVWPIHRAVFSIFFVTALFKLFEQSQQNQSIDYRWSAGANAALFICSVDCIEVDCLCYSR